LADSRHAFLAHHRDIIGARQPAERAGGRDIRTRKGERDQHQKADGQAEADLGLEERAEKIDHGAAGPGELGLQAGMVSRRTKNRAHALCLRDP